MRKLLFSLLFLFSCNCVHISYVENSARLTYVLSVDGNLTAKIASATVDIAGQEIQKDLNEALRKRVELQKEGKTGRSVIDEFSDNGVYVTPANNDVRAGINRTQERFKLKNGKPSIKIFQNCVNLRTELQTYRWKDLKPGAVQDSPEKPVKKEDHAVDALRYMICYLYDTPSEVRKMSFDYKAILKRARAYAQSPSWRSA